MDDAFANEPIPKTRRKSWRVVAAVTALVSLSLPTFLTGIEIGRSEDQLQGLLALLTGSAILTVIGGFAGTLGTRYRLTSYTLIRLSFGDQGSRWVNWAFGLSLIGWFGINIDLFSDACLLLFEIDRSHQSAVLIIEIAAGCVMVASTALGFSLINTLSILFSPILLVVLGFLLNRSVGHDWPLLDTTVLTPLSFSAAVSAVVGAAIIGAIILPDITRFVREARGGWWVSITCYLLISPAVMITASLATRSTGETDLLTLMMSTGLGLGASFIVIFGSWILNSLNLYSAVLSIRANAGSITQLMGVCLLGALGIGAATLDITTRFIDFLILLSNGFIPIAAIMITHFYWPGFKAHVPDETSSTPTNRRALIVWGLSLGFVWLQMTLKTTPSGIEALDLFLFAAITYVLIGKPS